MDAMTKRDLQIIATKIRMAIVEGTFHAKSGHPGGSLSIAEDMAYLFWKEMNIDPANPDWADSGTATASSRPTCGIASLPTLMDKSDISLNFGILIIPVTTFPVVSSFTFIFPVRERKPEVRGLPTFKIEAPS